MKMNPVDSSNIKAVGYDEATQTLAVEFRDGGLYHYHSVGAHHAPRMTSAESCGAYFHKHIKNAHRVTKQ